MPRSLLTSILLLLATLVGAGEGMPALVVPAQPPEVDGVPVLHAGRVKPFAVAAEESLLLVTGRPSFGEVATADGQRTITHSHRATEMVVAMLLAPQDWGDRPLVAVPWKPLQARLGIPGQWATLNELKPHQEFFAEVDARQQRRQNEIIPWSVDDEKAWEVTERWSRALDLLAGRTIAYAPLAVDGGERASALATLAPRIASEPSRDREWRIALKRAASQGGKAAEFLRQQDPWLTFEDLVRDPDPLLAGTPRLDRLLPLATAYGRGLAQGGEPAAAAARDLALALRSAGEARAAERTGESYLSGAPATYPSAALVDAELAYHRSRPFTIAWMLFVIGGLLTSWGLSRQRALALARTSRVATAGTWLTGLGCLAAAAGLGVRYWITGLGSVTNLYETLIFVSFLVALLGLGLARWTGHGVYAVCGGIGAGLCALAGDLMPPELGSQINQLQPVLRSRFWLIVHVWVVVSAYAPFLLALVLGNVTLWRASLERRPVTIDESRLLYRCLQWGTVLMAAGTILGGIWADKAWGRFWGWDPKEVGALTIVLTYLIPLHLRYAGLVGTTGLAAWSVLGFLSVLWSWYGVNFLLGAGMHAYAFGNGGQWIVLPLAGAQALLTTCQVVAIHRSDRPAGRPG